MEHSLNSEYIVTCQCPGTPEFAKEAYSILFPHKEQPELFAQKHLIASLADKFPNSDFRNYLLGLVRSKEKFAYLFEISPNGEILKLTNLKTGARVQ